MKLLINILIISLLLINFSLANEVKVFNFTEQELSELGLER